MRFTVVTYGSEGDTRPLAALCHGMMDAGHEVRLFAEFPSFWLSRVLDALHTLRMSTGRRSHLN
jgi:sterol 3beta-glucosyltransferase